MIEKEKSILCLNFLKNFCKIIQLYYIMRFLIILFVLLQFFDSFEREMASEIALQFALHYCADKKEKTSCENREKSILKEAKRSLLPKHFIYFKKYCKKVCQNPDLLDYYLDKIP